MRYILLLCLSVLIFSCGKDKVLQLPEITHSEISEINDVSAAYLFYDETKTDSVELNRKNLISTTNWLVNVDKRLTLKQAIPKIKFLQEKKQESEHKNDHAKNYFTCNDANSKNLGFIEFTDVVYHDEDAGEYFSKISDIPKGTRFSIAYYASEKIEVTGFIEELITITTNESNLTKTLSGLFNPENIQFEIILNFNQNITFQDYITFKSILSQLDLNNVIISNHEFIFN
jgi:hypothetical protein